MLEFKFERNSSYCELFDLYYYLKNPRLVLNIIICQCVKKKFQTCFFLKIFLVWKV